MRASIPLPHACEARALPLELIPHHVQLTGLLPISEKFVSPRRHNCYMTENTNLKGAFQFNNEKHNTYNLRKRGTDLAPPMPKKEFGKRCLSYNGALHWNNLPHEAKIAEP